MPPLSESKPPEMTMVLLLLSVTSPPVITVKVPLARVSVLLTVTAAAVCKLIDELITALAIKDPEKRNTEP